MNWFKGYLILVSQEPSVTSQSIDLPGTVLTIYDLKGSLGIDMRKICSFQRRIWIKGVQFEGGKSNRGRNSVRGGRERRNFRCDSRR